MGYLKIARELLNSSFWRSLAPAERGVFIDLMGMATYKPRLFNMNGYEIQLDCLEICLSINSYAKNQGLDRSFITRFVDALVSWRLVRKEVVYLSKIATNKTTGETTKDVTSRKCSKMHSKVTLLSFNEWIFAIDSGRFGEDPPAELSEQSNNQSKEQTSALHNKEGFNKESLKEDIRRNSARAVPSFQELQKVKYRKPWYPMEDIAEMNVPNADEILNEWTGFSGRAKNEVMSLLQEFAKKQKLFGLTEMTLDVFDKEFRKEMKKVFALKSPRSKEAKQKLKELGTDD
ncbi:MAG: hypothetical protein ACRCX4_04785 [Bacteroidales bacterium]